MKSNHFAIIGGGIAGLSAAYYLEKLGIKYTLFEESSQLGDTMNSQAIDEFTIEKTSNTILLSDQRAFDLFNDLDLEIKDLYSQAHNIHIVKNKKCIPLPTSFLSFIKSSLFSANAKLKIITEPFRRNNPYGQEESVSQFIIRRFDKETLDYAVNPFIESIIAGNPDSLSIEYTFPTLYNIEKKYGSIIGGFFYDRKIIKPNKIKSSFFSLKSDISQFAEKFSQLSEDSILCQSKIYDIRKMDDGYNLSFTQNGKDLSFFCNNIISTIPTHKLKKITLDGQQSIDFKELSQISYPPFISISIGFKSEDIACSLRGVKVLVPKCENMNISGVIFYSSSSNKQVEEDHYLLKVFIGGSHQNKLKKISKTQRLDLVMADLKTLFNISGEPLFVRETLWEKSLPQYHVGYGHYKSIMNMIEAKLPNFYFAGNYVNGVSIQDTILSSMDLIDKRLGSDYFLSD